MRLCQGLSLIIEGADPMRPVVFFTKLITGFEYTEPTLLCCVVVSLGET